jgi:hypothetical protein
MTSRVMAVRLLISRILTPLSRQAYHEPEISTGDPQNGRYGLDVAQRIRWQALDEFG